MGFVVHNLRSRDFLRHIQNILQHRCPHYHIPLLHSKLNILSSLEFHFILQENRHPLGSMGRTVGRLYQSITYKHDNKGSASISNSANYRNRWLCKDKNRQHNDFQIHNRGNHRLSIYYDNILTVSTISLTRHHKRHSH